MIPELELYSRRGWRCVPILPGTKRPAWNDWPRRATADPAVLEMWWGQHPDHGIGIATGRDSGIWVLDVDPRNGGDETLHDLEVRHGSLDGHYEVLTGGGGRHLYFPYPPDGAVHPGILGSGLDIKSDGGQVLAPPTVHPDTGRQYALELGGAEFPVWAPAWLLGLVGDETRAGRVSEPTPRHELSLSPLAWDRYNAAATNELTASLMEEMGWVISERRRNGTIYLTRPDITPGEGKEGTSMTVGEVAEGVAFCWTSSVPGWLNEHPYDCAEILARARFAGDEAACDRSLADGGWGLRSRWEDYNRELDRWIRITHIERDYQANKDAWDDVDVAHALESPPVLPSIVRRTDGLPLLYPGMLHWISGHPECGKSWIALHAVKEVLAWGGHVLYLDYENGLPLFERLLLLGANRAQMIRQLHVKQMPPSWDDAGVQDKLLSEAQSQGIRLTVVDSASSCMSSAGLDPNSNAEVLRFADFVRRLTIGGAAAIVLDHLRKDQSPYERYPSGGGQKLAQADVTMGVDPRKQPAPGRTGELAVIVHKDRPGQVRKVSQKMGEYDMFGIYRMESGENDSVQMTLRPYSESTGIESARIRDLPYEAMQAVTDLLISHGAPLTARYIKQMIVAPPEQVNVAFEELERRTFISEVSSSPKMYGALSPYRASTDRESPYYVQEEPPDV